MRLADAVIVAVKPQQFAALANSIAAPLERKLVVTVMAGVTLTTVEQALGTTAVVRCMPNLGAQIGRGATAWIASPACSAAQLELARGIFRAAGIEIEVRAESLLDAFTALGGTGPAYYFYLTELLAENAVAMGFDVEQARLLAQEVLSASARLLELGERSAADWRRAVTTRAGRPRPRCERSASMISPRLSRRARGRAPAVRRAQPGRRPRRKVTASSPRSSTSTSAEPTTTPSTCDAVSLATWSRLRIPNPAHTGTVEVTSRCASQASEHLVRSAASFPVVAVHRHGIDEALARCADARRTQRAE